ncbi:TPA: ATP-binding protein, partial [Pasteurella multocida]|nr:ATP-binding protein [Pasteurella multocida]
MIFTHLYIDNLYNFYESKIDLTFKREIVASSVPEECLEVRPKFKYKKLCILLGANASGKTSLGKILHFISSFLRKPTQFPTDAINNKQEKAVIEVEFVIPHNNTLNSLKIEQGIDCETPIFIFSSIPIRKNDSNVIARKRLNEFKASEGRLNIRDSIYLYNTIEEQNRNLIEFEKISRKIHKYYGWYYLFSNNDTTKMDLSRSEYLNANILKSVLTTFDSSITSVTETRDEEGLNGYNIRFTNKDSILIDRTGEATNKNRLSKGTYDAIQVADFLAWVIGEKSTEQSSMTYFLDEKMAYSHSEIEQAIVNLIVQKLSQNTQFFYTTHNHDI